MHFLYNRAGRERGRRGGGTRRTEVPLTRCFSCLFTCSAFRKLICNNQTHSQSQVLHLHLGQGRRPRPKATWSLCFFSFSINSNLLFFAASLNKRRTRLSTISTCLFFHQASVSTREVYPKRRGELKTEQNKDA